MKKVAARFGLTSRAWTIARTDLRQLRQSRDFWLPLGFMAGFFFVVLPAALLGVIVTLHQTEHVRALGELIEALPDGVEARLAGDSPSAQAAFAVAVYLFAPVAIVVPLTVSSAVGANTIVGERERGSGEFLAHSPATDREIYAGKLVASLVPGYLTAVAGFGAYTLVVNAVAGPEIGGWFFPTPAWWLLLLWVLPPFVALALGAIIAISARVSSAAAAQQASALVTLPLIVISFTVASETMMRADIAALVIGALAWPAAYLMLGRTARALSRERLLGA